ncbi:hypothetical protein BSK20_03660 [SR1 bacterium human oral taxon HOT-345]|nr:hypothetical protein BSK20_03660 [SR1 bacterium human oral taxon HOT-345]
MEKLLQLLNEYERSLGSDREWLGIIDEDGFFCTRKSKKGNPIVQHSSLDEAILQIISKKFGFIQWLMHQNKVEFDRARDRSDFPLLYAGGGGFYSDADIIVATLSMEDDPINFLVSILK